MRALSLACLLASAAAQAQVPSGIGYQGRLFDPLGTPKAGVVNLEFAIFDSEAPGTGTPIWCESHPNVGLSDGYYSLRLGDGAPCTPPTSIPLPAAFGATNRYLELKVEGGALSPRQKIMSVPFAYVATSLADGGASFIQNQTSTTQPGSFSIAGTGYVTGPAPFAGKGTVVATHGTNVVTGSPSPDSTRFGTEVMVGDLVIIEEEARHVTEIRDPQHLTVESNWTSDHALSSYKIQKPVAQFGAYSKATTFQPPALVIKEGGNVGIGVTNPSYPLDARGWIHSNRGIDLTSSNLNLALGETDYLNIEGAQLGVNLSARAELDFISPAYDSGPMAFGFFKKGGTAPPYKMTPLAVIQRNGRVGIGTTDPDSTLEIQDTDHGGGLLINGPAGDSANLRFRDSNQNPSDFNIDYTGGSLRFFTELQSHLGGTLHMAIRNTNGNVWIGGTLSQGSSQAFKKDITFLDETGLTSALKHVLDTPVATFRYRANPDDSKVNWGVIAERTPTALLGDDDKSINLSNTVGILIASIKAQHKTIEAQAARIDKLEAQQAQFEAQRAHIAKLETEMARLLARQRRTQ